MKRKVILGSFLVVVLSIIAYEKGYNYTKNEYSSANEETQNEEILDELLQVDNNDVKTSNVTKYILEYYNSKDYTLREENLPIPSQFIGLTRTELIEKLKAYEENPEQTDISQGFTKFELVSFSKNRIVLRKTYCPYEMTDEYILKKNGIYVSVFYLKTGELYENTTIRLEKLPDNVKNRIVQNEYITDIKGLYDFLENYSS